MHIKSYLNGSILPSLFSIIGFFYTISTIMTHLLAIADGQGKYRETNGTRSMIVRFFANQTLKEENGFINGI